MESLPEFVGTVHIFLGPYRGNPIALYMRRDDTQCHISPRMYPWSRTVGSGETPNKAAAAFEAKWKENELSTEMYSGPHWEGGIKPEKPKPPPKPAAPKPAAAAPSAIAKPATTTASAEKSATPSTPTPAAKETANSPNPQTSSPSAPAEPSPTSAAGAPPVSEQPKAAEAASPTPPENT